MDTDPDALDRPTPLLAGLSPRQFMRRHWQKRPLLVRGALPGVKPPAPRAALFELASRDDVESRLIVRDSDSDGDGDGDRWTLRHGPLPRRALPPVSRPGWTILLQGLDLHLDAARALLERFRFIPDARLDDLMLSYASDGGGVGPHVDSYDVFLVQVHGRRRWRISHQRDLSLQPDVPLKLLRRFEPEDDWVLDAGDLLYLPPGWAHDGTAVGADCMTCSVGLRAPSRRELARTLLQQALDADDDDTPRGADRLYADARQPATAEPGRIPPALADFAADAVRRFVADRTGLDVALGEVLTEPKPTVGFDRGDDGEGLPAGSGVRLDRRSRMLYDDARLYLNGESYRVRGRDADLLRRLADRRRLYAADLRGLSRSARDALHGWIDAGWLHPVEAADEENTA